MSDQRQAETAVIRSVFETLRETCDEIEGGQVPGAGWLHTTTAIQAWLAARLEWELTEGVALRSEASDNPTPPVKCDACNDTRRVPWMVEADPNLYQEPDADGTIPCPDCGVTLSPVEKCGACEWEGYPPNGCQHITPPAES